MNKAELRSMALAKRNAMTEEECMEKSTLILKKLMFQDAFLRACRIGLYASMQNEVITYPLFPRARQLDKEIAVPKVLDRREMEFRSIHSLADLATGYFQVPEPKEGTRRAKEPDLLVVPLVAFDKDRNRIGYGRGYYDTYLRRHRGVKTIGLAYECQQVPVFCPSVSDVALDMIITEERIYE